MYNKKLLLNVLKDLNKVKIPTTKKDINYDPTGKGMLNKNYAGKPVRLSTDTLYNPTPYTIKAKSNNGIEKTLNPYNNSNVNFPGADYIDEYPEMKRGGTKSFSSNLQATNRLFKKNNLLKKNKVNSLYKKKNYKGKTYDPNAKYYQDGGINKLEGDLISKVLMERNRGTDFVDRAYALGDNPGTPMFNLPDNEQFGQNMSHKMAWGDDDFGQAYMYPTIMNPNNEAIQVPNQYADYISSEGYKNATGMNYQDGGFTLELDDDEIDEYRRGGYIVEDISVPQLEEGGRIQKYQRAGEFTEDLDLPEQSVYGNEAKRKLQGSLIEKLIQSKKAYQDYRENAGLTKQRLRDEGASSIEVLKGQFKEYRGQLEEEKKSFAKAQKALTVLQKKDPENWKDKKLKDVLSSQGVDALRSLYKDGKMSDATFKDFYDNFGNQYDAKVKEGTGTGAEYSAAETKDKWGKSEDWKKFTGMVNKAAMAAPLLGGAGALSASAPAMLGANSGFLPAAQTAFNTSMLGVPGLTANNLLWGAGAYMSGDQIIDPNSATRTSINTAIKDPTLSNIGEAAANTTMTALGFAGLPIKAGVASLADDVNQAGKYLQKGYNQVATGNSALPLAWKLEKPTGLMSGATENSRKYIARTYTDREAELLSKFGKGMNLTADEWVEMQALTKSGATDFSKSNIPITRIPLYYNRSEQAVNEAKALNKLKLWQKYSTPSEKNIRTWSAGIPEGFDAERLARSTPLQKTRLVIPSKYTKGLGDDFSAMPYDDTRVDFIYPKDDLGRIKPGQFNEYASAENELMGNIPEGFIKIGSSNEGGFNNIIIKPIGKKFKELTKQPPGSPVASSVDDVGKVNIDETMSLSAPKGNMYGQNQVLTQQARLLDPKIKAKFFENQAPVSAPQTSIFEKMPKDYNNRITPENYDDFVKKIHASTDYDLAASTGKQPHNLGIGNYGKPGMVYKDAPLNNLGKDIIAGHEKKQGGATNDFIEAELTDKEIKKYRDGGYIVEEVTDLQLEEGGEFYTVKGSKSVYKKVNGKWQVDTNKSGQFQPLSKGNVKQRTDILNKQATPLFDAEYQDKVNIQSQQFKDTKSTQFKKQLTQDNKKSQENFDKNFKTNKDDKYTEILNKIKQDQQGYIDLAKQKGFDVTQDELNQMEERGWNVNGNVGVSAPRTSISNEDLNPENHISTQFPKNATFDDYGQRGYEYLTNPGTALEYALGTGRGPMPFNINKLKEEGVQVNSDRNLVGNMFNIINPLDDIESIRSGVNQVMEGNNAGYVTAGLGLLGFIPGLGDARKLGKAVNAADAAKGKVSFLGNSLQNLKNKNVVLDHIEGLTQGMINPLRYPLTSSRKAKLIKEQDDALKKAVNFTEEWYFNSDGSINNSVKKRMQDLTEDIKTKDFLNSYNRLESDRFNPMAKPNTLVSSRTKDLKTANINDYDKNYITENRGRIAGVNTSNNSITLRNTGNYYKKPKEIAGTVVHENAHTAQDLGKVYDRNTNTWSKSWGEGPTKYDEYYNYYTANLATEAGREFAKHMVPPKRKGSSHTYQTWKSSPNELHSDLMTARYNLVEELSKNQTKEFRDNIINRLRENPTNEDIDLLLKDGLNKFFKGSTSRENKRKIIRMLPALVPAAIVTGAALQEKKQGGFIEAELTQKEIDWYKSNGYIVQEINTPKMQTGGTPSQLWYQYTGTPWSEAKAKGLTDGSMEQNLALAERIKTGEFNRIESSNIPSNTALQYNQMIQQMVEEGKTLEQLVQQRIGTTEGLKSRFPELFTNTIITPKKVNSQNINNKNQLQIEIEKDWLKQKTKEIGTNLFNTIGESYWGKLAKQASSATVKYFDAELAKEQVKQKQKIKSIEQKVEKKVNNTVKTIINPKKNIDKPNNLLKKNLIPTTIFDDPYKYMKQYVKSKEQEKPNTSSSIFDMKKFVDQALIKEKSESESPYSIENIKNQIQKGQKMGPPPSLTRQQSQQPIVNGMSSNFAQGQNIEQINARNKAMGITPQNLPEVKERPKRSFVREQIEKLGNAKEKVVEYLFTPTNKLNPNIKKYQDKVDKTEKYMQNIYYDVTNPALSAEQKSVANKKYKELRKTRVQYITKINNIKKDDAGSFDVMINEIPFVGKPLQKKGWADEISYTNYDLPAFETYNQKKQKQNDEFIESTRIDDLNPNKSQFTRWKFKAAGSNDDPIKVKTYGTRGERKNQNINIKSKGSIMHFLDQSPITGYMHQNTKNFYNALKDDDYVGYLKDNGDNTQSLQYLPKNQFNQDTLYKNTFLVRQVKFDDINFDNKVTDDNFAGHKYPTIKGTNNVALPISTTLDETTYDYSSGQTVVYIFKYKGKIRYQHFAGSIKEIKNEGKNIKKTYGLKENQLTIGLADAGSYSSSISGDITNDKLNSKDYGYYNLNSNTGAGIAIIP